VAAQELETHMIMGYLRADLCELGAQIMLAVCAVFLARLAHQYQFVPPVGVHDGGREPKAANGSVLALKLRAHVIRQEWEYVRLLPKKMATRTAWSFGMAS